MNKSRDRKKDEKQRDKNYEYALKEIEISINSLFNRSINKLHNEIVKLRDIFKDLASLYDVDSVQINLFIKKNVSCIPMLIRRILAKNFRLKKNHNKDDI